MFPQSYCADLGRLRLLVRRSVRISVWTLPTLTDDLLVLLRTSNMAKLFPSTFLTIHHSLTI